MYAVTGITGRVGGVAGRTLLNAGLSVRAVVRDAARSTGWKECGSEVALADMNDAPALTAAFTGVCGLFVLIPPNFDPTPGFPEARVIITALTTAIEAAKPPKVVCLSVPRQTWEQLFESQGTKHPGPRIQMLDGFNQGWIDSSRTKRRDEKGGSD